MNRLRRMFVATVTAVAFGILSLAAGPASAAPVEVITNGTFETGTLAGWTVTDLVGGSGSYFIDDADGLTPFSFLPTVGPAAGSFYAVSDQTGPGTHALEQSFTIAAGPASVILSFDMFVNDHDLGPIVDPIGLDHTGPPNQHARVDILSAGSPAFDTGAGVLANYYLGVDPGPIPNPYTSYLFDITALVGGGGTFDLRFAEVDNSGNLNLGVDNVSILVTAVPEPSTLLLLGTGLIGLVGYSRRKRSV